MEKERNEFFAMHKNNIPSEDERYEAFLPLMRIEYGGSFRDNVFEARQLKIHFPVKVQNLLPMAALLICKTT